LITIIFGIMITKLDNTLKYGRQQGGFGIQILYPGLIKPELDDTGHAIPMVATRDVAKVAAAHLSNIDFKGKTVHAVMSPRNYTYREFTSIIGKAIGNPELPYVQIPVEQAKQVFLGNGFSEDFADNLLGMAVAIKSGMMNYQQRTDSTTTPTTAKAFVN